MSDSITPPAEEKPVEPKQQARSDAELRRDIEKARAELAANLDAIEYKLDVPARSKEFVSEAAESAKRAAKQNPKAFYGSVGGAIGAVAGLVGLVLWMKRR